MFIDRGTAIKKPDLTSGRHRVKYCLDVNVHSRFAQGNTGRVKSWRLNGKWKVGWR
jgi:hypothetical protein